MCPKLSPTRPFISLVLFSNNLPIFHTFDEYMAQGLSCLDHICLRHQSIEPMGHAWPQVKFNIYVWFGKVSHKGNALIGEEVESADINVRGRQATKILRVSHCGAWGDISTASFALTNVGIPYPDFVLGLPDQTRMGFSAASGGSSVRLSSLGYISICRATNGFSAQSRASSVKAAPSPPPALSPITTISAGLMLSSEACSSKYLRPA